MTKDLGKRLFRKPEGDDDEDIVLEVGKTSIC